MDNAASSDTKPANNLQRNFRLFFLVSFLSTAQFSLPIYLLLGTSYLQISYFQAGALFLTAWVVSLVCDFLGGTFADKYGRKKMFLIGLCLQIINLTAYVLTKDYSLLLVTSALSGLGMAFVSNTLIALLYEQSKATDQLRYFQHGNAVAGAMAYGGRFIASIVGGFAYLAHPTLPYGLSAIALVLALFAGASMRFSTQIQKRTEHETTQSMMKESLRLFTSNPSLIKFTLVLAMISFIGDYLFNNYQPYYLAGGASPVVLGFLFAGISLLSGLGTLAMRFLPNRFSPHAINSLIVAGVATTPLLIFLLDIPASYIAPIGMALVSGFSMANLNLFVNAHASNKVRSSVLSIATTSLGIGSGLGILVGLSVIGRFSTDVIMLFALIGCLLVFLLNVFTGSSKKSSS